MNDDRAYIKTQMEVDMPVAKDAEFLGMSPCIWVGYGIGAALGGLVGFIQGGLALAKMNGGTCFGGGIVGALVISTVVYGAGWSLVGGVLASALAWRLHKTGKTARIFKYHGYLVFGLIVFAAACHFGAHALIRSRTENHSIKPQALRGLR